LKPVKSALILMLIICFLLTFSIYAEDQPFDCGFDDEVVEEAGDESGEEPEIIAEEPLVVTTCGQSPGSLMAQQLARREGIEVERQDLLTADYLREKFEADEGFRTLFITIGTSGKGLGAAGINMDDEEKRINSIIEEARNQEMLIIGGQIEGEERRMDRGDERSMHIVAPQVDILIVHVGANKDNYYTDLAEELGIPIYYIEGTMQTVDPLRIIFGLAE